MATVSAQVLGYGLPPTLQALVERHQTHRVRTAADRSLALRLKATLPAEGVTDGLSVYIHDGAVSLYGTVATATARESVVSAAAATPGVRRIVDHLRVMAAAD